MKIKTVVFLIAMAFLLGSAGISLAASPELEQFWKEKKEFFEKSEAYKKTTMEKVKDLETRMAKSRASSDAGVDQTLKNHLSAQYGQMQNEKNNLLLDLAKHSVKVAEQEVTYAQRRLEFAKEGLNQAEARCARQQRESATERLKVVDFPSQKS